LAQSVTERTEQEPSAKQHAPVFGGEVYVMVSCGRWAAVGFVRELKRFVVPLCDSLPRTAHPKLLGGPSSHAWASATMSMVEDHVYEPMEETFFEALSLAT
jgi:hypothetical protein